MAKAQKAKIEEVQEMAAVTDEVQYEWEKDAVVPEETEGPLKNLVDSDLVIPQPVDSDGKQDDGFQAPPEAGLSSLEALLAASTEERSAFDIALDPLSVGIPLAGRPNPSPGMIAIPTAEEIAAVTGGDRMPKPTIADIEEAMANGGQNAVQIEPDGTVKFSPAIGPHPNGDYGVVVTVSEPMVSGVLGQAELDGVSPSEWLSVRVKDYLEQWFFGR